jgi:hypothetical protein
MCLTGHGQELVLFTKILFAADLGYMGSDIVMGSCNDDESPWGTDAILKYVRTLNASSCCDYPSPVYDLGQGRIVQGHIVKETHRPGTHCPRDASSTDTFSKGRIVQGHIVQETHRLRDV